LGGGSVHAKITTAGNAYFLGGVTSDGTTSIDGIGSSTNYRIIMKNQSAGNPYVYADSVKYNPSSGKFTVPVLVESNCDIRLKENIVDSPSMLGLVNSLKTYNFDYKERDSGTYHGFMAHELQEVLPTAVDGTKDGMDSEDPTKPEYMGMKYAQFPSILTKCIQELTAKIDTLEAEVEALKAG